MQKLNITAADSDDKQIAQKFAENLAKLIFRKYPEMYGNGAPVVTLKERGSHTQVEVEIPCWSKDSFLSNNLKEMTFWVVLDLEDVKAYVSGARGYERLQTVHWSFSHWDGGRNGWEVTPFTWKMI